MKTITKKTNSATSTPKEDRFISKIIENLDTVNAQDWESYTNITFLEPKNLFTKKSYKGFNILSLFIDMMKGGYRSNYYATFNTISKAGGKLKKGAKGALIEFYNTVYKDKETNKIIPDELIKVMTAEELSQLNKVFCARTYVVFNSDLIENFDELNLDIVFEEPEEIDFADNLTCENFINKVMVCGDLKLETGKRDTAFYAPAKDYIFMPDKKYFISESKYYSTFFHEIIHWTGHESRLNRDLKGHADIKSYSFEELIAEMGSMLICLQNGILSEFINSVRYLKGWSEINKSNRIENIKKAFVESKRAKKFLESF